MRWYLRSEPELELELEGNPGKCQVWGSQVYILVEYFQAQELASLELGCSLEFPRALESSPRPQVQEELLLESQGLDPLGASSLESHWGTPSKPPSCQVAMDYPTALENFPMVMAPEEWQVQGARLATRQAQELVPRLQPQPQPKQLSTVLQEPESSRVSEAFPVSEWAEFLASEWAEFLVQFLGLVASQGLGLLLLRLLRRQPRRQPSMELLEA